MVQTVLITGGSRGIGAGTVRLFAERGWRVLFTYVSSVDAANALSSETEAVALRSDIGKEVEILSLFEGLDQDGVYLDALVNNAGITGPKRRLLDLTPEILEEISRVNFTGPVLMAREAVKRMSRERGGKGGAIVNISSTATHLGSPNQWIDYAALKGGIDVFTKGLAREVGEEGIRVNAVSPGYTMTDPNRETEILSRFESMRHEVPLGRIGSVREVAEAVYWLCSNESSYVTGTVVPAAGGR